MPRHALILLAAIMLGCAPRASAPLAPRQEVESSGPGVEGRRTAVTLTPIERGEATHRAPPSQAEEVALRRLITVRLEEVASVMKPLCDPWCGVITAIPDPELDAHAALRRSSAEYGSVMLYRPASMSRMTDLEMFWSVAHEYGHHLGVTMSPGDRTAWQEEIHADVLAGCAIARSRRSMGELRARFVPPLLAVDALERLRDDACGSDPKHPSFRWHWQAIEAGAALCKRRMPKAEAVAATAGAIAAAAETGAMEARGRLVGLGERDPCRRRALPYTPGW